VATALERIVLGLFKTNVLATVFSLTRAASLERVVGNCGPDGSVADGIAVFALYPLFLYCNFSGYIDIVLGIAKLLRRRLPENFNRPFSSTSVIDFWNRWHITLSLWLKTYVYTPLLMGLGRRFPSRKLESTWAVFAFFVTFFLVGVWHGQTLEFLVFGFLTGLGMSANKMYQLSMQKYLGKKTYARVSKYPLYVAVARGLTIAWFAFTLWWFWGTWEQISQITNALGMKQLAAIWLAIIGGATALLWAVESVRDYLLESVWRTRSGLQTRVIRAAWSVLLMAVVGGVVLLSNQPAPEIVYKAF
jgi:D-alanyl-lipoteichoic acid acyltransferase DltB (MBOAT superfamily)